MLIDQLGDPELLGQRPGANSPALATRLSSSKVVSIAARL
jgi:hypothetical protein